MTQDIMVHIGHIYQQEWSTSAPSYYHALVFYGISNNRLRASYVGEVLV